MPGPRDLTKWERRAMDRNSPLYKGKHTVLTAGYEVNGKHIIVPTLRQKGKKLVKVKDPVREALKNNDYRVAGSERDSTILSKDLSKEIGEARSMPQGFKDGADVDFYMGGDQDFAYGGGKLSYNLESKKMNIKPSQSDKKAFDYDTKSFKVKPYITASGSKKYKKDIEAGFDRFGLDTEYNTKKFNLKTRYSQNVSGAKNKRFNADLSYRPNEKTKINLKTDADKRHRADFEFKPNEKTKFNINTDLDKDHDFGFEYKGKNTNIKASSDADKDHSVDASYTTSKGKRFTAGYSERRGYNVGLNFKFSKGGSGGCPHRETGAKSDIQGIKDIQTTGKKFIGVK